MHVAIYRKYRPKTFADVIGQGHITETLKNEIAQDKISHAYIFTGTRGTGKTTCAKIFAKAINCECPENGEPCLKCDTCLGVEKENILEIVEVDAASNTSVDYVRELREEAVFSPANCKYRVFIIDEVHMLSGSAFNALLKIMEEPPAHVIFILATTEIHKVPATVLSRCQRFDFRRVTDEIISQRIEKICTSEGVSITPDASLLVAKLGLGSVRDALSVLEKCVGIGSDITAKSVRDIVGIADPQTIYNLVDATIASDGGEVLKILEELYSGSKDFVRLCDEILEFFRDLMVAKLCRDGDDLISGIIWNSEKLHEINKNISIDYILDCITALTECRDGLTKAVDTKIFLEVALIRLCNVDKFAPVQSVKPAKQKVATAKSMKKETANIPIVEDETEVTAVLFDRWGEVVKYISKLNMAFWSTLQGSNAYLDGGYLLIDSDNETLFTMLRENKQSKEYIREALKAVTGNSYKLGPYKGRAKKTENDISEYLEKARQAGVEIDIK